MKFRVCPDCGAHLDPGEICDCHKKENPPADVGDQQGEVESPSTSNIPKSGGKCNMKEIKINRLLLENFKCHSHLDLHFDGQDMNIHGDNATGKTSVYDGLTWLLFGKDSLGNGNPDIKPLDQNGQVLDHNGITSVEAEFLVDGVPVDLRRTLREVWSTRRGSSEAVYTGNVSDYAIDGVPVKKNAYDSKILEMVPEDVFRMLTNVTFFADGLKWQDRRAILFEMTGVRTDKEIMSLDDRFAQLAENMGNRDLFGYKKMLSSQRKQYTVIRDDTPTRISECQKTLDLLEGINFNAAKAAADAAQAKVDELADEMLKVESDSGIEQKRLDIRKAKMDLKDLERANSDFRSSSNNDDAKEIESEIASVQSRLSGGRRFLNASASTANNAESEIQKLRKLWVDVNGESFAGGVCPTCGQTLPFDVLQKKTRDFDDEKHRRLDKILDKAKAITERMDTAKQEAERWEKDVKADEKALSDLQAKLKEAKAMEKVPEDMPNYQERKKALCAAIESLQNEVSNIMYKTDDCKARLNEELKKARQDLHENMKILAKQEVLKSTQERIESLRDDAKKAAAALEEIDSMLFLIEDYTRFKASCLEDSVNDMFTLAQFRLFKDQANGGVEDRCDVVYDGVPYSGLNNGMRINLGIDIINALSRHYGVSVPLFIDNAESITRLIPSDAQVIRLVVDEEYKELMMK